MIFFVTDCYAWLENSGVYCADGKIHIKCIVFIPTMGFIYV